MKCTAILLSIELSFLLCEQLQKEKASHIIVIETEKTIVPVAILDCCCAT